MKSKKPFDKIPFQFSANLNKVFSFNLKFLRFKFLSFLQTEVYVKIFFNAVKHQLRIKKRNDNYKYVMHILFIYFFIQYEFT